MRGTSFWKTFAKTLPRVLLTGIVGPIFLILHLVLDDAPGWLFWAGSGILGVVVLVTALISATVTAAARERRSRAAHGVPAIGRIVGSRDTGTERNGRPVVVFDVDVDGPRVDPFTTRVETAVPTTLLGSSTSGRLGLFVGGDRTVTVDWRATALYRGQTPAHLVSEARGKTYDLTGCADHLLRIVDVLRRHGIALGGALDGGDSAEARTQIQAIVDEFGMAQESSESRRETVSRRLADVEQLLGYGQITRGEYEALRARILHSI